MKALYNRQLPIVHSLPLPTFKDITVDIQVANFYTQAPIVGDEGIVIEEIFVAL